jgi:hypothetical protein
VDTDQRGRVFAFGEHWREVREAMRPFDIPIVIVVLILVALYVYRYIRHMRTENEQVAAK